MLNRLLALFWGLQRVSNYAKRYSKVFAGSKIGLRVDLKLLKSYKITFKSLQRDLGPLPAGVEN